MTAAASARFARMWATDLVQVGSGWSDLDAGRWGVSVRYDGQVAGARFAKWSDQASQAGQWRGPATSDWSTSMGQGEYCSAVDEVRAAIARGDVYQANICRVLQAPLPDSARRAVSGLDRLLAELNPSPYGGYLDIPELDLAIASASPELFLSVRWVEGRRLIRSGPIKGTGLTADDLRDKDTAENIMIVDLVRNDLSRVCRTGSVQVPHLLAVEEHPGLVHLVSYVEGELIADATWQEIAAATFPPGSVTGAPKSSALRVIDALETRSRGPYCGAFGWIDIDRGECELAVSIRTFWIEAGDLCFGTGAGITWGSDPVAEWEETELKASRLIGAASGTWPKDGAS